jgi:uncharacterized protein YegJ (DUF2314 family)
VKSGSRSDPGQPITLSLLPLVPVLLTVFFIADQGIPEGEDLVGSDPVWAPEHVRDPLGAAIADFRKRGLVLIEVVAKDELPDLPLQLLESIGLPELEERVLGAATHAVLVRALDLNVAPRIGIWAVLEAACEIADRLHGVVFDPEGLRVITLDKASQYFERNGAIVIRDHVIVPFSVNDRGVGWMTTRGMSKFGLPELEVRDIPPDLIQLSYLVNTTGQFLVEHAFRTIAAAKKAGATGLEVPPAIALDGALLARANGDAWEAGASASVRSTVVSLRFTAPKSGEATPFAQIVPPPGFSGDMGVWLNASLRELLGPRQDHIVHVDTGGEAMQRAHVRSVAELPDVKARFSAGLRPGQILYVKHGFPTPDGSKEYMWLAVEQWTGGQVVGTLVNEPDEVPELELGQKVAIDEADIFDWMIQLSAARREGGYTLDVASNESR